MLKGFQNLIPSFVHVFIGKRPLMALEGQAECNTFLPYWNLVTCVNVKYIDSFEQLPPRFSYTAAHVTGRNMRIDHNGDVA